MDYRSTVWIDRAPVAHHEGGYTPFDVRLMSGRTEARTVEIVLRAEDGPTDLCKPRGKQASSPQPSGIWYPRTTGIWQAVWMEHRPDTWIDRVRWTANLERWEIGLAVWLEGVSREGWELALDLRAGDTVVARDRYSVVAGEVHRRVALSDPGVDDFRNALLWSPESPTLLAAQLDLLDGDGQLVDRVASHTALRSVAVDGGRFLLNNRPEALGQAYLALMRAIHDASLLSGFCYTQFADTYQEANGLLNADRTPKFPIEWIAACTRGRFDLLPP